MTKAQVAEILGTNADLMSENRFGKGTHLDIHTELFMWKNTWGSNCNVTFQNGRVVSKAQFGLR
jgi:hypothetical protein